VVIIIVWHGESAFLLTVDTALFLKTYCRGAYLPVLDWVWPVLGYVCSTTSEEASMYAERF